MLIEAQWWYSFSPLMSLCNELCWSVQFSSVSHVWLCDPMDWSTPGFPVHHEFPELTQTHVHQVGDAIQPSHLLSSPSPPAFSLSQHHGLFKWVSSSKSGGQSTGASALALVLPMNIQGWFPFKLTGLISLQSKRLFSSTTVWRHQFFGTYLLLGRRKLRPREFR